MSSANTNPAGDETSTISRRFQRSCLAAPVAGNRLTRGRIRWRRTGSAATGSDAERRALIAFLKTFSVRPSATCDGARRQYRLPQSSVRDKYPTRRCAASERPDAPQLPHHGGV